MALKFIFNNCCEVFFDSVANVTRKYFVLELYISRNLSQGTQQVDAIFRIERRSHELLSTSCGKAQSTVS